MDIFLQQLLNALSLGGTYALLALGLAVVFSIIGLINVAHGELMTVTGYAICFSLAWGLPFDDERVQRIESPRFAQDQRAAFGRIGVGIGQRHKIRWEGGLAIHSYAMRRLGVD